eukprot:gb/GFBE01007436.1/.p1 GENE.gb/GFBE01007436.1/~~gb/GFBE01007436.1/.p1  ORF type:complete len:199 (+),score=30.98 gb/GFBE01007436.1/:1-597(+)
MFGEAVLDVVLGVGDVLFVPRGFPHRTLKQEGTSVSLTLGLPTTMYQLDTKNLVECAASSSPEVHKRIANGTFNISLFNQNLARATRDLELFRADIPLGFLRAHAHETILSIVNADIWGEEWRPSTEELWSALDIYQEEVGISLERLQSLQQGKVAASTELGERESLQSIQREVVQPLFAALGKRCSYGSVEALAGRM